MLGDTLFPVSVPSAVQDLVEQEDSQDEDAAL